MSSFVSKNYNYAKGVHYFYWKHFSDEESRFQVPGKRGLEDFVTPGWKVVVQMCILPSPQPNWETRLIRLCLASARWGRNTPFNRHEAEEQLGVTETQQVTAEEEQVGGRLPGEVWLESELQIMRKHPGSRIATISYER